MQEEVGCMREDWKREQMLVLQLENDLEFKDNQLQEAIEENAGLKVQVMQVNADNATLKAKIWDHTAKLAREDGKI